MMRMSLLALYCADLAECKRFYETIGLTFSEEEHLGEPVHPTAALDGMAVMALRPAAGGVVTRIRLGFAVEDPEATIVALREAGFKTRTGVATDPDGRKVEISSRVAAAPSHEMVLKHDLLRRGKDR